MELSQPAKKPTKRRKTNWIRGWVQLFFFVLIALISINTVWQKKEKVLLFSLLLHYTRFARLAAWSVFISLLPPELSFRRYINLR